MHEHHLVEAILEDILRRVEEEGASRVTRITMRLGGLTELDEETIRHLFADRARGTPCEGAGIVFERSDRRELTLVSIDVEE